MLSYFISIMHRHVQSIIHILSDNLPKVLKTRKGGSCDLNSHHLALESCAHFSTHLLKTRQQAQTKATYAKPHVTKPGFNSFGRSLGCNLKSVNLVNLVSTSKVLCLRNPCCPLKEGDLI